MKIKFETELNFELNILTHFMNRNPIYFFEIFGFDARTAM